MSKKKDDLKKQAIEDILAYQRNEITREEFQKRVDGNKYFLEAYAEIMQEIEKGEFENVN